MKILVVDDDPDVAEVVSLVIQVKMEQTETLCAHDGVTGVKMARKEKPDAVILDIGLPDIDGFEVCKQIRRFSNVPVIFLSVRDNRSAWQLGLQIGADDYVIKPFKPEDLVVRLKAVLGRASTPRR